MGLALLLAPQDAPAEALGEAAVQGEVVLGAQLEHEPEVLMDEAQPVGHHVPEVEGLAVELGRRCRGRAGDSRRAP